MLKSLLNMLLPIVTLGLGPNGTPAGHVNTTTTNQFGSDRFRGQAEDSLINDLQGNNLPFGGPGGVEATQALANEAVQPVLSQFTASGRGPGRSGLADAAIARAAAVPFAARFGQERQLQQNAARSGRDLQQEQVLSQPFFEDKLSQILGIGGLGLGLLNGLGGLGGTTGANAGGTQSLLQRILGIGNDGAGGAGGGAGGAGGDGVSGVDPNDPFGSGPPPGAGAAARQAAQLFGGPALTSGLGLLAGVPDAANLGLLLGGGDAAGAGLAAAGFIPEVGASAGASAGSGGLGGLGGLSALGGPIGAGILGGGGLLLSGAIPGIGGLPKVFGGAGREENVPVNLAPGTALFQQGQGFRNDLQLGQTQVAGAQALATKQTNAIKKLGLDVDDVAKVINKSVVQGNTSNVGVSDAIIKKYGSNKGKKVLKALGIPFATKGNTAARARDEVARRSSSDRGKALPAALRSGPGFAGGFRSGGGGGGGGR